MVAEQHDRDKEQDEHATLLQQLQRLLEAERIQRENCEHQVGKAGGGGRGGKREGRGAG